MFKDISWRRASAIMFFSLIILFGGWYLHMNFQLLNPMEDALGGLEGVTVEDISIENDTVNIDLGLESVNSFQDTYSKVIGVAKQFTKNREVNITITNQGNQHMIQAWNESYFYIAEAIDRQEYSFIPNTVDRMKNEYKFDRVGYSMDQENIYIDLHEDNASLYFVIPKELDKQEVSRIG